jgi:ATP-dependent 26S proteasome regulatory subunit
MPQLASEVFQQMTSLDMMKRPGNEHDMEMLNRQMVALQDMIQKNPALEFKPYKHEDEDELSFGDDIDYLFSDEPDGSATKQQIGKRHRNYDTIMETQFDFKIAERREGKLFGFDAVAGMDGLKNRLRDEVLLPLRNQEAREKYGLQAINGMLLYGPPGNGKTYIAERFAEEAGMNCCFIKSSDLSSSFSHGSQQLIAQLFNQAEEHKPCILCIDEIDAILGDRTRMTWSGYAMEVNEMLSQMNNCSERGIFVIATTNNLDLLDPAVLRAGRLDEKIYVPLPDEEARKGIFKLNLQKAWTDGSIDFNRLASLTKDYVSADITLIANRAKLLAFKRQCPISQAILEKAISTVDPSLTTSQIKLYEKISYGKRVRPQIGFVTN